MNKHLFIGGMEKCGTTALASWLVAQGIAEYLVPGMKEPNFYARTDFAALSIGSPYRHDAWRLDASVGYALNPDAIARMPEHFTRMILCFRNPWERTWSAYKMKKAYALGHKDLRERVKKEFPLNHMELQDMMYFHYSSKLRKTIDFYLAAECARFVEGDFLSRIRYEIDFFYVRGNWPFLSILGASRYRYALGNILEKFAPEDLFPVCVPLLDDAVIRRDFVKRVLGQDIETGPIELKFVLEDLEIGESKPDFSVSEFDFLRSSFAYDLEQFEALFPRYGLTNEFMDFNSLRKNVI